MAKRYCTVNLDGEKVQLRLTVAGQRALREKSGEETLQTILEAAGDSEKMAMLLDAALNWEGNRNHIQDGEALYDRLVDSGWCGQVDFGALALDIAAQSGLLSEKQADQLKQSIANAVQNAFQGLDDQEMAEENGPF